MSHTIASCGHKLEEMSDGFSIATKDQDKEGKPAVRYSLVCKECFEFYKEKDLILKDENEERIWLTKDTSIIPKGDYCYNEKGNCPYWSLVLHNPLQENGFCGYLEKSDYDINREHDDKDIKVEFRGKTKIVKGKDLGINFSLLWDQCKECGINMEDENEERDCVL